MGYTKICQMSHLTIVTEYQKNVTEKRKTGSKRRPKGKAPYRSARSIKRARDAFFRLVDHNLHLYEDLPYFLTLTYHNEYETLPTLTEAYEHQQAFWTRVKKTVAPDIAYISVPEWQKRGAIHFHALVWNLPSSVRKERDSRILQRCWRQGYCDVRATLYKSPKLPGYLSKYLTKAKNDQRLGNRKAYTASRNIDRPREKGSNFLSDYLSTFVENEDLQKHTEYDTKWLGRATIRIYKNKKQCYN